MSGWQPIETAPVMVCALLFDEYYSHGRVRHGYRNNKGEWRAVNANGTDGPLSFAPSHWQPLPAPPHPVHKLTPEDIRTCSQAELEARGLA